MAVDIEFLVYWVVNALYCCGWIPTFRRIVLPPSLVLECMVSQSQSLNN
jgi:hypothetical protein